MSSLSRSSPSPPFPLSPSSSGAAPPIRKWSLSQFPNRALAVGSFSRDSKFEAEFSLQDSAVTSSISTREEAKGDPSLTGTSPERSPTRLGEPFLPCFCSFPEAAELQSDPGGPETQWAGCAAGLRAELAAREWAVPETATLEWVSGEGEGGDGGALGREGEESLREGESASSGALRPPGSGCSCCYSSPGKRTSPVPLPWASPYHVNNGFLLRTVLGRNVVDNRPDYLPVNLNHVSLGLPMFAGTQGSESPGSRKALLLAGPKSKGVRDGVFENTPSVDDDDAGAEQKAFPMRSGAPKLLPNLFSNE
ncbi:hypothetical protein HWI79_2071 [Cryptosporidium felis]|nr:hypothetical protein HWI79_2071 [Cryptosporidium felis]